MTTLKTKHFIGTQYYRAPNPEPELWEQDFAEIARLGMSVVRCWIYWRTAQPAPDRWDWSSCDRFLDLAAKNGLKALIQLVPESSPQWFINQHPDLRPLGWDGRPMPMDGNGMIAVGGYPGMFFDQPVVAEAIADFFNAAVQRYASHPALYAWDPWNEIAPHGGIISYDEVTRKSFQRYLQTRFASVENLNAVLQQQFQSFDDVPLLSPDTTHGPTMFRVIFEEFRMQRLTQEMARRCRIIRAADPHHRLVGHVGRTMFHSGIQDDTELSEPLDAWGFSSYRIEYSEGAGQDYREIAMELAFTRACRKPFWLSEHSGGQVYYHYGHHVNTGAETRSSILMTFGHGGEAALFWQYRHERFGQEAPSWGLLNFDGSLNDRVEATQGIGEGLREHADLLEAVARPASAVGIVYDKRVLLMEGPNQAWVKQEVGLKEEVRGWFAACHAAGHSPEIIHAEQAASGLIPDACRILILPMHAFGRPDLYQALLSWVEAGGVLICTAYSGTFDQDGYACRRLPLEPLASALGLAVIGRRFPKDIAFEVEGSPTLQLKGHHVIEDIRLEGATVAAQSKDQPVVLHRPHGKGELWYLATCPGTGYRLYGGELPAWIDRLASAQGSPRWYVAPPDILGERSLAPNAAVLYLSNPLHEPATVTLVGGQLPAGEVYDLLTNEILGTIRPDQNLDVVIPPRDTLWLGIGARKASQK